MEDASGSDEVRPLEDEDDGAINLFDDDSFLKESSMDLAPSLLNLFDAVIRNDSVDRGEILAGIDQKQKDDVGGLHRLGSTTDSVMADGCTIVQQQTENPTSFEYTPETEISLANFPESLEEEQIFLENKHIDSNFNLEMNGFVEAPLEAGGVHDTSTDEVDGTVKELVSRRRGSITPSSENKSGPVRTKEKKDRPASAEILMDEADFVVVDASHQVETEATSNLALRKSSRINPPIALTLNLNDISHSPLSSPPPSPSLSAKQVLPAGSPSYLDRIVKEVVDTEHKYVSDLAAIIKSYMIPIQRNNYYPLTEEKFNILFCNLYEIYSFNKDFLGDLEQCNNNPVYLAECFLESEDNFSIYTTYCTNYPEAVKVLTECVNNDDISTFFREIQSSLGHGLPLGAYLLKPVQRILKYHLLFQDMCKHYDPDSQGYETIKDALESMVYVATHINEMKRKHETAIHVQEIQSQLHGMQENITSYGDLILEDNFRMRRAERYLYLFEKALLICKKDDSLLTMKACIKCSNLMLCESLPSQPLAFNVVPFDQPSTQYTILAKTADQKKRWTHEIKRLILENYQRSIPANVKALILSATTPEDEVDRTPGVNQTDGSFPRNKKERRSGRKNRRRNSEPIGKQLQRGQKQVKAAVESFLTGMKRPDLSKLGRTNSDGTEGGASPDDSLDERMEEVTEENEMVEEPEDGVPVVSVTSLEGGEDTPKVASSPSDDISLASSLGSFSKTSESKRDSGIGSMTITETPKSETDERSDVETPTLNGRSRMDTSQLSPADASIKRKVVARRRKLSSKTEDSDGQVEEMIKGMESPDELEALENLSEEEEDRSDSEQPKSLKKLDKDLENAFKLRRKDMKHYQRILKKSEVWEKKTKPDPKFRARSASHSLPRSAHSSPNIHPHLLLRSMSDSSRLAFSKPHSYSDPNIAGSVGSSSEETIEESSKESSRASLDNDYQQSQDNFAETIGNALRTLEAKYSQAAVSERSDSEDTTTGVVLDDSSEGTESLPPGSRLEDKEKSAEVVEEEPIAETPKRVFSLARKFSVMAKDHQKPSTFKSVRQMKARERRQHQVNADNSNNNKSDVRPKPRRPSKSDPFAERDGTRTVITVSENKDGTKCVITNKEGSQRLTQSEMWRQRFRDMNFNPTEGLATYQAQQMFVDVSDAEEEGDSSVFVRGGNRLSVKDTIESIESRQEEIKGSQGATPYQAPSIRERLRSMQEQAKASSQSVAHAKLQVANTKFKSLQQRLQELEQCKEKQYPRMKAVSSSSDFTDGCSSPRDDLSGSQASSRRSSCSSNGLAARRSGSFTVYEFSNFNESAVSSSRSSFSTEDDASLPLQFKSIRQRREELQRAIAKPVPKYVDPMKDLKTIGRTSNGSSDSSNSPVI